MPAQATAAASNTPVVPTATASPSGTGSSSIDDNFMRADQTGWGTGTKPDGVPGVTWGIDGSGARPSVTISNNVGVYGYPGVTNVVGIAAAGSTTYNGGDALVKFSVSAVGHVTPYVVQNACPDKSCYYGARLHTSRNRLEVAKRAGNMTNILASVPFTAAANTIYWMRLHVTPGTSTTLQATVWADGAPEPSSWMVSTTDASPLAANRVGTGGTWDGAGSGESIRYTWFAYAANGPASPPP